MHNFFSFIKEFRISKKQELHDALKSFSKKQFYVFTAIIIVAFISMIAILNTLNNKFLVDVPVSGGSITEGIIGMPTLVNPILSVSDADKDLVSLVYSGLMRRSPNGTFIPDLATSYTISPDGLNYTFIINKNAKFHDGTKLTADDVVFTVNKIKDSTVKSPRRIGWDGINVEKIDDYSVIFKLKQPYISFLDNMTMGILPYHIWKNVNGSEFNLSPFNIKAIGSGPYKIKSVLKNKDGIPEKYMLRSFADFTLGAPHIKSLNLLSFSNEKNLVAALMNGSINQASSISPKNAEEIGKSSYAIHTASTPRIFGLFYNSLNNRNFADSNVINAINYALDKNDIVNQVLYGYGTVAKSPVPETIIKNEPETIVPDLDSLKKANDLLDKSGWTLKDDGYRSKGGATTKTQTTTVKGKIIKKVVTTNTAVTPLEFSLTTGDTPELKNASEIIKNQLAKIGIRVITEKVYEMGPLNQIIRNREYEALFFGQIVNHESDLFSFWHSSQKKDPGLNIAMYSNSKVDKILEDAQKTINQEDRDSKYMSFVQEFNKDLPAILIYSPKYLYVTSSELNNINIDTITSPSDRFASIYTWYAEKDHVWKIFTK